MGHPRDAPERRAKLLTENTNNMLAKIPPLPLTMSVEKCAVVVRNEANKVNPLTFKWKWGEDKLPIVDQYRYLGVDILIDCSWDAHIAKSTGKGKAYVGKIDATLTDLHLDTINRSKKILYHS